MTHVCVKVAKYAEELLKFKLAEEPGRNMETNTGRPEELRTGAAGW